MLKLEDLFYGSDLVSHVFKTCLLKIGQFSTDYIFSMNDLTALHGEVFQRLIDPLTQFTDCVIRIKDFNKLDFNYVFLLKDASLRGCLRFLENCKKKEAESDSRVADGIPHGALPETSLTRSVLEQYTAEIECDNYQKILEFVRRNAKLDAATIMKMVETGVMKVHPFLRFKIDILANEMLNRYVSNWKTYLQQLIERAFSEIAQEKEKGEKKKEELSLILETGKGYLFEKRIPKLVELRQRLLFDLKITNKNSLTKEDVDRFLLNKNDFFIFQMNKPAVEKKYYGTFDGEAYHIDISDSTTGVKITENSEKIFSLTEKKLNFLREKVRNMVSAPISIEVKNKYENYGNVYVLYKRKRSEIFDLIIDARDLDGLKIILAVLEYDSKDPLVKTYYDPVEKMKSSLEQLKIDELLLSFVKNQKENVGFFAKLFGLLFSASKENDLKNSMLQEKTKIAAVTKSLTSVNFSSDAVINHQTPIQSAIGILRSSNHGSEIAEVLKMDIDNGAKVARILKLCQDIGNTNKAYIGRSERTKAEFLEEVKKNF